VDGALGEADLVQVDDLQLHVPRLLYSGKRLSLLLYYSVLIGRRLGLAQPHLLHAYPVLLKEPAESNRSDNLVGKSQMEEATLLFYR
jgi:hypothetical protein